MTLIRITGGIRRTTQRIRIFIIRITTITIRITGVMGGVGNEISKETSSH